MLKFSEANKRRYVEKHDEIRASARQWRKDNWDTLYPRKVEWNKNNIDQVRNYQKNWASQRRLKNTDEDRAKQSARQSKRTSERAKEDPLFAMKLRLRKATCKAFSRFGYTKKSKTNEILGCSWEEVKAHIESLFKDGMSWENRKDWHIDHIIPLASAKNEDELKRLCHFKNLQPLWGRENIIKGNKLPE
jgi:hypothetical protein